MKAPADNPKIKKQQLSWSDYYGPKPLTLKALCFPCQGRLPVRLDNPEKVLVGFMLILQGPS